MKPLTPKMQSAVVFPMVLIKCVFGIGIFEYPIGRPRPVISVACSIVNFLIYLGFLKMANLSEIVTFHGSVIAANSYCMIAYFSVAFVIISIFLTHMKRKVVEKSQQKLNVINDRLRILGIPDDFKVGFKAQINRMIIVFAYISILIVLDFKCVGYDLPSEWSRVGFLMISHYFLVFTFLLDGTITAGIGYFGNRFQRLNALLADSALAKKSVTMLSHESDDQFERYSSLISEIHQNNPHAIRMAEKQWLLYVIRETRLIHRGLSKTMMELNRAFGIQLLFSVALSFGLITALFYTSYVIASSSIFSTSLESSWMSRMVLPMWIMFFAMKVILIVDAIESTSCEADRTKGFITKLLDSPACDEDIRDEIGILSLQLLHNPVKFTAHGFFPMNYSLIHGMIGTVTTYLIIMIQMRNTYDPDTVSSIPMMLMLTNGTN